MSRPAIRHYYASLGGKAATILHSVTVARDGEAFDFEMNSLASNVPIMDKIRYSFQAFKAQANLPIPFLINDTQWDYATTVAKAKLLETDFPTAVTYHNIAAQFQPLASGREMSALKINEGVGRKVWFMQTGTHGNEMHALRGCEQWVRTMLTSNDPLYVWMRENIAIHWIVLGNPDATFLDQRRNAAGVNLNRNWDWFWEVTPDPDKGATAFSEIESRNVRDWIAPNLARGLMFIDWHMWQSDTSYGYLHDNMLWHGTRTALTDRACYHYINNHVGKRNWAALSPVNGVGNMKLSERKSARRPYPNYWSQIRMPEGAFSIVMELPETENQYINGIFTLDTMDGVALAIRDLKTSLSVNAPYAAPQVLPGDILNNNSTLTAWSVVNKRPNWMTLTGLSANLGEGYIELTRSGIASFISPVAFAGYVLIDGGTPASSYTFTAGGLRNGNAISAASSREPLEAPAPAAAGDPIPVLAAENCTPLPKVLQEAACCVDGSKIYTIGGFSTGGGYNATVYSIPLATPDTSPWATVATLTAARAVQRHTAHFWNGKIVVVGGRSSAAFKNEIYTVDVASGVEALLTTFTGPRAWHGSALVGDILYVVGGWGGATAKTDCFTVNLTTGVVTLIASLPFSRRQGNLVYDSANGYLWWLGGRGTDAASFSETIYYYSIAANTWTGLLTGSGYTRSDLDPDSHDPASAEQFFRINAAAMFDPYTGDILIYGGEDNLGQVRQSVYVFDTNARTLGARDVSDTTWGYMRSSQSFNLAANQAVSYCMVVKNADTQDEADIKAAYVRPTLFIGPLSNYVARRYPYTIPPDSGYMSASMNYKANAGADQLRIYLRHYTGGTRLHVKGMQLVNKPYCGVIVPLLGKSADSISVNLGKAVRASAAWVAVGAFMPRWGSQQNFDVDVLNFVFAPGSDITELKLRWVGAHTSDSPGFAVAGNFKLSYVKAGVTTQVDLGVGWELNHDRFVHFVRADCPHFKLKGVPGVGIQISLAFYGKVETHTVPTTIGAITKVETVGSGIALHLDSSRILPPPTP